MKYAPVAQLDRVTDYESVGRGFESLPAYQKIPRILEILGIFCTLMADCKKRFLVIHSLFTIFGYFVKSKILCKRKKEGRVCAAPFKKFCFFPR